MFPHWPVNFKKVIMTVKDLRFESVVLGKWMPVVTCCNCGVKTKVNEDFYFADYSLNDRDEITFFLCNVNCVLEFNSLARKHHVQKYINDLFIGISKAMYPNDPFQQSNFLKQHNISL
jgi:hypothetical protein